MGTDERRPPLVASRCNTSCRTGSGAAGHCSYFERCLSSRCSMTVSVQQRHFILHLCVRGVFSPTFEKCWLTNSSSLWPPAIRGGRVAQWKDVNYEIPGSVLASPDITETALNIYCHLLPAPFLHVPIATLAKPTATCRSADWQRSCELPPTLVTRGEVGQVVQIVFPHGVKP